MTARLVLLATVAFLGACSSLAPSGPDPAAATLRLFVDPCDGVARRAAMAVMVDVGLAATVAHPFLDQSGRPAFAAVEAIAAGETSPVPARVVFLDAERDVALLALDDEIRHLQLADHGDDVGVRVVAFGTAPPGAPPRTFRADVTATGRVSFEGKGERTALELDLGVRAGDSGAPVIDDRDRVIGIVFATDRETERSWAIAASEYEETMAQQRIRPESSPVEGGCDQPSSLPTIETKLTHSPGAPPRLWVMPSFLPPSVTVLI